jgi:exportin-2 (importin alpha re-exporter)
LEQIRSQICDNVGMYARKYDEEFEDFLPLFVTAIWTLLTSTGNQMKFDMLVSNSIQFLALVAEKDRNKHLFENEETMSSICQKVIIPNMEFRGNFLLCNK